MQSIEKLIFFVYLIRYDIVDLMLEDFESVDEQHHPIDFHLYFKMLFKLQNSIDMDDIFERNNRHRAYSIHSQGLWNKIDPVINEALQNQLGVPSSIDEGYRYITFLSREECSEVLDIMILRMTRVTFFCHLF